VNLRQIAQRVKNAVTGTFGVGDKDAHLWTRFGMGRGGYQPGSKLDWATIAGPIWLNSAASIGLNWLGTNFAEPPVVLEKKIGGKWRHYDNAPKELMSLVNSPCPAFDWDTTCYGINLDLCCTGDALLWLVPNGAGTPIRMLWIPRIMANPQVAYANAVIDDTPYVGHWHVAVNGRYYAVPSDQIIHIRHGVDPQFPYLGLGPLRQVLREIALDNAATTYSAGLMHNVGMPAFLIAPELDEPMGNVEFELFVESLQALKGDNAGKSVAVPAKARATRLGFSPDEMGVERIRDVPETRIASALGLNAMTIGLSAGARQKTYANYGEAERQSQVNGLTPKQKIVIKALGRKLLPIYGLDPLVYRLWWDWSDVQSLREQQDSLSVRIREEYKLGLHTKDEARALLGYDAVMDETGEDYFGGGGGGGGFGNEDPPLPTQGEDTEDPEDLDPESDVDPETDNEDAKTPTRKQPPAPARASDSESENDAKE